MDPADLTLLVAFGAGLLSFLSPCVLPLVPAYIGQLTVVAVVGRANAVPSRWLAVRHAVAYVLGFGVVFTILGITATFVGGPLADYLPAFRTIGGILLIVMGLNLAGILRIPALDRTWRPLEAGAAGALAQQTGTVALAAAGPSGDPGLGERLGGRIVGGRGGVLSSFGLGVVFAVGWTPCIGIILGQHPDSRRSRPARRCRAVCSSSPTPSASAFRSFSSAWSTTGRRFWSDRWSATARR